MHTHCCLIKTIHGKTSLHLPHGLHSFYSFFQFHIWFCNIWQARFALVHEYQDWYYTRWYVNVVIGTFLPVGLIVCLQNFLFRLHYAALMWKPSLGKPKKKKKMLNNSTKLRAACLLLQTGIWWIRNNIITSDNIPIETKYSWFDLFIFAISCVIIDYICHLHGWSLFFFFW